MNSRAAICVLNGCCEGIRRGVDDGPDEAVNVCCASKRAQKRGSPFRLTNACSAGRRPGTTA